MVKKHTKKEKSNKKVSYPIIIGAVLLVVLIFAITFLFANQSSTPKLDYSTYNGFEFTKMDIGWQTLVQKDGTQVYETPFYNHPLDIEGVEYDDEVTKTMQDIFKTVQPRREIILAIPPESGSVPVLAGVNIAKITGRFYESPTSSALFVENVIGTEYENATTPVVSCADSNYRTLVIKIDLNQEKNSVERLSNFCFLVGGQDKDGLLMAADLLGYKLLGIMQ